MSSNPEIVQHGVNGLLAKPFESEDLTQCVLEIMNSPQLREEFVKNGERILNEKFDNQKIYEQLKAII